MKVVFLDFDGVLNSTQSNNFWKSRRTQDQWEKDLRENWKGSMREYMAQEFCPISMSNVEELVRRVPDLKIVVSSSWRKNETPDTLRQILVSSKIIGDAIVDVTPDFHYLNLNRRGEEIQDWLNRHPEVTDYVIVDDEHGMLEDQKKKFVRTSPLHGFQYGDMLWALRILGEGDQC